MDATEVIRMGLEEYMEELREALDGLTDKERRFQPGPESHHIDFCVWHMARVEDNWINRFCQRGGTIWQRDDWFKKLEMPERDSGFGYTAEQVASLTQFDFDQMMAYCDAVRKETLRYLDTLKAEDLDRCPDERRPDHSIGKAFSHLIVEEAQHVGQVAYIRGIQRGIGK